MFKGIYIENNDQGYQASVKQLSENELPDGNITVNVLYSSLNYKDALAITGKGPVVRRFPMVPGIDLVGTIEHIAENASSHQFAVGDTVLLNGFGVGEKHWGGLAKKARLHSDWLIPLPENLLPQHAMAIGTAGYTAMLSVMALEKQGITPEQGDILVTGANGGVGSFAIAILAKLGYRVVASTGRLEQRDYLKQLGACEVIDRNELSAPGKPLAKERWAGAVDSIGSNTLANVCAGIRYGGAVTACGLAQGMDFNTTVAPFILRGITLVGIDSVMCSLAERKIAWQRIAQLLDHQVIERIYVETDLAKVIELAEQLIAGKVQGRIVVKITESSM